MDLNSLKLGFYTYLQNLENNSGEYTEDNDLQDYSDVSIFAHAKEFKEYIQDEYKISSGDLSLNINDILKMELVNGQLINPEEAASASEQGENKKPSMVDVLNIFLQDEGFKAQYDSDNNGEINASELSSFQAEITDESSQSNTISLEGIIENQENETSDNNSDNKNKTVNKAESSNNIISRLFDKMYADEKVVETLDLDGDGQLSEEEKSKFEEFIKGYDGDGDELTEADLKRAYDDILKDDFSYNADLSEKSKEIDELNLKELQENEAAAQAAAQNPVSPSGGGGGGGGYYSGTAGSSNSFSDSNSNDGNYESKSVSELESLQSSKKEEIDTKREEINEIYSGENDDIKSAMDAEEDAKTTYLNAVKEDENVSDELKEQLETKLNEISEQEQTVNDLKVSLNDAENAVSDQEALVASDEANISAIQSAISSLEGKTSDDPEVQAQIAQNLEQLNSELQAAEGKKSEDEKKLNEELIPNRDDIKNNQLPEAQTQLDTLEQEKETIQENISSSCSSENKQAIETASEEYDKARENVPKLQEELISAKDGELQTLQTELDEITSVLNDKKAEEKEKEYSVSDFEFDFDLNLSDRQSSELGLFKENWEKNKDKYEAVEKATGMPAELIAAIHWREGGGDFSTYLHNGQKLGQVTTAVPKGIYFEDWTEAAIDAVTNYGTDLSTIDPNDINTYYNYAEHYNGMGYHNKGLPSPYVWAGTSNYEKGKYVADGVFDPNYVDQQLGVAVMLQALLS